MAPSTGAAAGMSVVIDTDHPLADEVLLGLDQELRRIFYGSAVPMEIVTPDLNSHPVFANEIVMTRIRGACQVDAMPALQAHKPDTLGRTLVTDGRILPYIELDCRQIAGAVKKLIIGLPAAERSRLLGRAMARVVAHEIYHVLAQTHRHNPGGLAAESMSSEDLVGDRLDFRFDDLEAMGLVPVMATR